VNAIKSRIDNDSLKTAILNAMRVSTNTINKAVVYALTGDETAGNAAVNALRLKLIAGLGGELARNPAFDHNWFGDPMDACLLYDLTFNLMPQGLRDSMVTLFNRFVQQTITDRAGARQQLALFTCYGDTTTTFPQGYKGTAKHTETIQNYLDVVRWCHFDGSGMYPTHLDPNNTFCGCTYRKWPVVFAFTANATNQNFYRYTGMHNLVTLKVFHEKPGVNYMIMPDPTYVGAPGTPYKSTGEGTAIKIAYGSKLTGNGLGKWFLKKRNANSALRNVVAGTFSASDINSYGWVVLLDYYDKDLPEVNANELPLSHATLNAGYYTGRSDWTDTATLVYFESGPISYIDHPFANGIEIYKKGELILIGPMGEYFKRNDFASSLQFDSSEGADDDLFCRVARPSVLKRPYGFYGPPNKHVIQNGNGGATSAELYSNTHPYGSVKAYETHPAFDYIVGDATIGFDPSIVTEAVRQFVYIRPGYVITFDRATSTDDRIKKWRANIYPPTGMSQPMLNINGSTWSLVAADQSAHDLIKLTPRSDGAGRLYGEAVLPSNAVLESIKKPSNDGQPGGQYVYYAPDTLHYLQIKTPAEKESRILVLMKVSAGADQLPSYSTINTADSAGVEFTEDGTTYRVVFNKTGAVGGHISISGTGDNVDVDFTSSVENNYEKWIQDSDWAHLADSNRYGFLTRPLDSSIGHLRFKDKGEFDHLRGLMPELFSPSPNPFRPNVKIAYYLPRNIFNNGKRTSRVHLKIYDVAGRLVKTLVNRSQAPGFYQVSWDGRSDAGNMSPGGIYFYRLLWMGYSVSASGMLVK
jgi:hypothetical protein